MWLKILVWSLILSLNLNQLTWAQPDLSSQVGEIEGFNQAVSRLDRFMSLLAQLRSHIDRSQFDPDALLDRLDYDPEQIIRFTKKEILFEQYSGLLRGAKGTLVSRAGNSLDQAVLLASMLKDAGLDARIARGQLAAETAAVLLDQMGNIRPNKLPAGDVDAMAAIFVRLAETTGATEEEFIQQTRALAEPGLREEYAQRLETEVDFLTSALQEAGHTFNQDDVYPQMLVEATDYFWVEYRVGTSQPWQAVHPAFRTSPEGIEQVTAKAYYADQIPADLSHRFGFEATITQKMGTRLVETVVVPKWERPAANVIATPLTFTITSRNLLQLTTGPADGLPDIETDLFIPSFSQANPSIAFDFSGTTLPLDVALSAYAGVFQTVGDRLGNAVDALVGIGSPKGSGKIQSRRLEKVKLKYFLVAPDGSEQSFERIVYDAEAPYAGAPPAKNGPFTDQQAAYRALTRVFTIGVAPARLNAALALDQNVQSWLDQRPAIEHLLRMRSGVVAPTPEQTSNSATRTLAWDGMHDLNLLFSEPVNGSTAHVYSASPSIVVHHRTLPVVDSVTESIDIVDISQTAIEAGSSGRAYSARSVLEAGVWASLAEGIILGEAGGLNTEMVMSEARTATAKLRVIEPGNRSAIEELVVDDPMKKLIQQDLDNGFVVVFPELEASKDHAWLAWWRVNPKTGETLGVGQNGEGAAKVEYVIALSFVIGLAVTISCLTAALFIGGTQLVLAVGITCIGAGTATFCGTANIVLGGLGGLCLATTLLISSVVFGRTAANI